MVQGHDAGAVTEKAGQLHALCGVANVAVKQIVLHTHENEVEHAVPDQDQRLSAGRHRHVENLVCLDGRRVGVSVCSWQSDILSKADPERAVERVCKSGGYFLDNVDDGAGDEDNAPVGHDDAAKEVRNVPLENRRSLGTDLEQQVLFSCQDRVVKCSFLAGDVCHGHKVVSVCCVHEHVMQVIMGQSHAHRFAERGNCVHCSLLFHHGGLRSRDTVHPRRKVFFAVASTFGLRHALGALEREL